MVVVAIDEHKRTQTSAIAIRLERHAFVKAQSNPPDIVQRQITAVELFKRIDVVLVFDVGNGRVHAIGTDHQPVRTADEPRFLIHPH